MRATADKTIAWSDGSSVWMIFHDLVQSVWVLQPTLWSCVRLNRLGYSEKGGFIESWGNDLDPYRQ